ncbi:MAG: 3-deoxy-8-phosphooctulonate synthase [Muribaculaceae bacterium]|nr:3-deoxy-8-phosphooctulonate synthase [Muribaculaceae bacterium]
MKISEYIKSSKNGNFFLLAGPCVIEGEEMALDIAEEMIRITDELNIPYIFKGSYKKANRSRLDSFTGIGDEKALKILRKVKDTFNIPVVTDIHTPEEAAIAAEYVDVLQIPAFLCRQTDLLVAAAKTGKFVNIKKGQFLAPESMRFACEKVRETQLSMISPESNRGEAGGEYGGSEIAVTDRGTFFGYGDLIVDMRGIPLMKRSCECPVIMDITHSLQQPNRSEGVSGGLPELISTIAFSSIAAGADGIFMETHRNPAEAKSDGANMLPLSKAEDLLTRLSILKQTVNRINN